MWKFLSRPDKSVPLRDGNDESILATRPICTANKRHYKQTQHQSKISSENLVQLNIRHQTHCNLTYFLFWWKNILPLGIRRKTDAKRRRFDSSFRYPTPNKLHLNHSSKSQCNHLFVTQGSYLSISLLVLQNNMFFIARKLTDYLEKLTFLVL